MNRYIFILPLFISLTMFSQETNNDVVEDIPTKLEQLIIDIESEIDIEKRFDFSRSNTKERQLQDLKRINNKLKSDLKAAEDLSVRLIAEFDENEKQLSELEEKLTLKLGNLGEMFGVVVTSELTFTNMKGRPPTAMLHHAVLVFVFFLIFYIFR